MAYEDTQMRNPIKGGFTTEHADAVIVIGALALLWLIGRGFRGVNVGGFSARVG